MIYRQNTNQVWVPGTKSMSWLSSGANDAHTSGGSFSDSGAGYSKDGTEYSLNSCGGVWRQRLSSGFSGSYRTNAGSESYSNSGAR